MGETRSPVSLNADGTIVYGASALGGCMRSLVAARLGETPAPPPAWLQARFDESSALEIEAIQLYEHRTGGNVIWQQKEVEIEDVIDIELAGWQGHSDVRLVGHIDGMDRGKDEVIEVKVLGPQNFAAYNSRGLDGLKHLGFKYRMQASIYAYATDRQVRMVILEKTRDPDSTQVQLTGEMIVEPWGAWDAFPRTEVIQRVRDIEELAMREEYPDCTAQCYPGTDFWHIHEQKEAHLIDDVRLAQQLEKLWRLESRLDELNTQRDDLRTELLELLEPGKSIATGWEATRVDVKEGQRFDATTHRKSHPECHEGFMVPKQPYSYITNVKPVED